jgi:hypothetical protein
MLSKPTLYPQFLVKVGVFREGVLLGEDAGVLTFVDGWMLFEGEHSGFSIAPRDVSQIREFGKRPRSVYDAPSIPRSFPFLFILNSQTEAHSVGIRPIVSEEWEYPFKPFQLGTKRWVKQTVDPLGVSVLPPSTFHSTGTFDTRLGKLAVVFDLLAAVLVVSVAVHVGGGYGLWPALFVFLVFGWRWAIHLGRSIWQFRKVRRLRRRVAAEGDRPPSVVAVPALSKEGRSNHVS